MSAAGYEGGGYSGAGGKFRKQPFRRDKTTPYDRPATALRPSQAAAAEKNGWLSKLVDPASRLITYGAHKLFSSVFRKRLLPPATPTKDDNNEKRDVQPETTTSGHMGTKEPATSGDNGSRKITDINGVSELESILKQKTFTRSEIDHLTMLLRSRTVDNSVGADRGMSELKTSDLRAVFDVRLEKDSTLTIHENGIEHVVPGALSTPGTRAKVLAEEVASPAELAKAYMGSRTAKVSPSGLGLQNQPKEESTALYNPAFKLRSPATSHFQKHTIDVGPTGNGFVTPRFRGRSAIYNMARTPYSRMHPTAALKATETVVDTHGGSSLSIVESQQLSESKKQALKRRSSVLENDIGSVGPIRRIRQKPNLLHPKTLILPTSSGPRAALGSGPLLDAAELASSSGCSGRSHSLSKSIADNNKPSTSSGYVPSQSIEMAQKIFEQLDKFTPKGKSSELKNDIGVGISSAKMTPALSGVISNRSTETVYSLKVLKDIQDSKKENGLLDTIVAHVPLPETTKTMEEASIKKLVAVSDHLPSQTGATTRGSVSYSSHDNHVVSHSDLDPPQKKHAFQMSAHEDFLELDDDVHVNGVASMPSGELAGRAEFLKKSASIPSSTPLKEESVAEKPAVSGFKPSESLIGQKEAEPPADGPVASNMGTSAVTLPKSTADSVDITSQNETVPALKSIASKLSPFSFSTSPVTQSAVQDSKSVLPSSSVLTVTKTNGPGEMDKKATQELVGGCKKPEDGPSPVISPAEGYFNFGSPANTITAANALSSPIPTNSTSSSSLFSNISSIQSAVPVSGVSSPPPSSGNSGSYNGFATRISTSSTATVGTAVGTATTSDMASLSTSNSQLSSSATTSVSSGPTFQFGSVPSTSATFGSASFSAEKSGAKLVDTTSTSTTNGIFGAKSVETASGGTGVSGFSVPMSNAANSNEVPTATGSVFGFQSTHAVSSVSTSSQSFPSQFASSPAFGSSVGAGFSSGASLFGAASSTPNPFSSATASASSSSGISLSTSSGSSVSGSGSSIFGSSWPPSKSTLPSSTFDSALKQTGLSFGAAANGSSTDASNKPSAVFGSLVASSSSTSSSPFLFGSTTSLSSGSSSASSSPFLFGSTPSLSSSSSSASSSPFLFGSTASLSSASSSPFLFGSTTSISSSSSSTSSSPFLFGSTTSLSSSSSSASSSPFVFGSASSSASPAFSFSSSISAPASNAPSPSQPMFGNNSSTPTFAFGSTPTPTPNPPGNNDHMSMEDSMAEDSIQAPTAATPASVFGQSPMAAPSSGFSFGAVPSPSPGFMGAAAPQSSSGSPFQFGSQSNQMPAQGLSAFQPSGSVEFNGGSTGSFSLGTGGGDKSNRRIIKPKSKVRRK